MAKRHNKRTPKLRFTTLRNVRDHGTYRDPAAVNAVNAIIPLLALG